MRVPRGQDPVQHRAQDLQPIEEPVGGPPAHRQPQEPQPINYLLFNQIKKRHPTVLRVFKVKLNKLHINFSIQEL